MVPRDPGFTYSNIDILKPILIHCFVFIFADVLLEIGEVSFPNVMAVSVYHLGLIL